MRLSGNVGAEDGSYREIALTDAPYAIGRSEKCDWTIPDPSCALSRHHCTLKLLDGAVTLTDHSTHGTSIGRADARLALDQPTVLSGSTTLYLADTARIDITCGEAESPLDGDREDFWPTHMADLPKEERRSLLEDAERPERLDDLADRADPLGMGEFDGKVDFGDAPAQPSPPPQPAASVPPPRAPRDPVPGRPPISDPFADPFAPDEPEMPDRSPAPAQAGTTRMPEHDPFAEAAARPVSPPEPARAAPPPPPPPPPAPEGETATGTSGAEEALFAALGLDAAELSPEQRADIARRLGTSYGAFVAALYDLLAARTDAKVALGLARTQIELGANPLKAALSADDALQKLLRPESGGYLDAAAAAREAAHDLHSHQIALVGGIRSAIRVALDAFDPETLEKKIEKQGILQILPMKRKAELWDSFVAQYRDFAKEANDDIVRVMRDEFDRLYDRPAAGHRGTGDDP